MNEPLLWCSDCTSIIKEEEAVLSERDWIPRLNKIPLKV